MKKMLLGFILGLLICGGIVYATSYFAKDISYQPSDTSWEVDNVNEALDNLYEKTSDKSDIVYLGTGTSFDVSDILGFEKFTEENFIVGVDELYEMQGTNITGSHKYISAKLSGFSIEKTYDKTTGVLTISGLNYKMTVCNDNSFLFCSDISVSKSVIPYAYLVNGTITNK